MLIERKSLNDILTETPDLLIQGDWFCLNIETNAGWPTRPQPFRFEDHQLWIMPYTIDNYPGIAINRPPGLEADSTWALLYRSLSLITWLAESGAVVTETSGGNLPRMMAANRTRGIAVRDSFDLSDLPKIQSERGWLALALMREGRGLNHPGYAFLSFFRALEIAIPDGRMRGHWVTDNIDKIKGHAAKEALAKLRQKVSGDIGVHLRESGRHAIAHAQAAPIINPDDPKDTRRLKAELPIIEALATLAIEKHLSILTTQTIWEEHLYELRGWKAVFGDQLVADIIAGSPVATGQQIDMPVINARLRRSSLFSPLEGMFPLQLELGHAKARLTYRSTDQLVHLIVILDFLNERLLFDVQHSLRARDDGSATAARNAKELARFNRDYLGNGELQIWNADTGALLSKCDAFIPVNCFVDFNAADTEISYWEEVIAEREANEGTR